MSREARGLVLQNYLSFEEERVEVEVGIRREYKQIVEMRVKCELPAQVNKDASPTVEFSRE